MRKSIKGTRGKVLLSGLAAIFLLFGATAFLIGCKPVKPQVMEGSIRTVGGAIEIQAAVPNGAVKFEIYRSPSRLGEKTHLSMTRENRYIDQSPNENKYENHYTVIAKNESDRVISGIRWNKIDNAASYAVYRRDSADGEFNLVGTVTERHFTEAVAVYEFGITEYRVDPINASGNIIKGGFDQEDWDARTPTQQSAVAAQNRGRQTTRNIVVQTVYPEVISFERELFGSNVYIYDAGHDSMEDIDKEINYIADAMRSSGNDVQMSDERYSFYFKPGNYILPQRLDVGFYMTVAGLGLTPAKTRFGMTIFTPPALGYGNQNASNGTHNFWRAIENFEIYRPQGTPAVNLDWSVSQAAPMRRISVAAGVNARYSANNGWVSGGYTADVRFAGSVSGGGQQQWYTRNSHFGGGAMSGVSWNNFAIASTGEPLQNNDTQNYLQGGSRTWIADGIDQMREKPFLYFDTEECEYKVFIPSLRKALGVSWTDTDPGPGVSVPIGDFYTAKPGDTAAKINAQLDAGKHLFYTPGIYECETPVYIKNPDTVVLGTGLPTIHPSESNTEGAMLVSDVSGVTVAGMFIDAHYSSKYLLRIGEIGSNADHSANPSFFSDVFLRVGGYKTTAVHAEVSVHINSNNVVGDHFWVWRADHGRGGGKQWRWDNQIAPWGVVVHGNDVTMHGLFVEHFQKYQTLWLGERGRVYFYQNETPYEVPGQANWKSHEGTVDGWSAFKVANGVNEFYGLGIGVYGLFNHDDVNEKTNPVVLANALEVPNKPGIKLEAFFVNKLSSSRGDIQNIINGVGGKPSGSSGDEAKRFVRYEDGIAHRNGESGQNGIGPLNEDFAALLAEFMR